SDAGSPGPRLKANATTPTVNREERIRGSEDERNRGLEEGEGEEEEEEEEEEAAAAEEAAEERRTSVPTIVAVPYAARSSVTQPRNRVCSPKLHRGDVEPWVVSQWPPGVARAGTRYEAQSAEFARTSSIGPGGSSRY